MDSRQITPEFSVAPQIEPGDMPAIKAAGFRTVICNRPDGEEVGQTGFAEIAEAARAHGLVARHVPVASGMVSEKDAAGFGAALQDLPRPILAYCRSGARSATLWSLWHAMRPVGQS